jgi:hypothetical protein
MADNPESELRTRDNSRGPVLEISVMVLPNLFSAAMSHLLAGSPKLGTGVREAIAAICDMGRICARRAFPSSQS